MSEKNVNTKFLSKLTPEMVGGKPRTVRFILGNGVEVQACLDNYSQDCGLQLPEIQLCRFGSHSVAVGAAALIKHALVRPLDLRGRSR